MLIYLTFDESVGYLFFYRILSQIMPFLYLSPPSPAIAHTNECRRHFLWRLGRCVGRHWSFHSINLVIFRYIKDLPMSTTIYSKVVPWFYYGFKILRKFKFPKKCSKPPWWDIFFWFSAVNLIIQHLLWGLFSGFKIFLPIHLCR